MCFVVFHHSLIRFVVLSFLVPRQVAPGPGGDAGSKPRVQAQTKARPGAGGECAKRKMAVDLANATRREAAGARSLRRLIDVSRKKEHLAPHRKRRRRLISLAAWFGTVTDDWVGPRPG